MLRLVAPEAKYLLCDVLNAVVRGEFKFFRSVVERRLHLGDDLALCVDNCAVNQCKALASLNVTRFHRLHLGYDLA